MTRQDIDTIISIICPNDEDFEKACISPAYLKNELEILALDQEPCEDVVSRQAAIDALGEKPLSWTEDEYELGLQNQWQSDVDAIKALPSAQPRRCARSSASTSSHSAEVRYDTITAFDWISGNQCTDVPDRISERSNR